MQALGLVWGNSDSSASDFEEIRMRIDAPTQYGARLLVDHWRARDEGRDFVVGRDVPARALAPVLRNLALYEPVDGASNFRIRLAGAAFMRRFGRDVTGMSLADVYNPANFTVQRNNLVEVMGSKESYIWDVNIVRDERLFLRYEAVRLPVLSPDRGKTWVMGGLFYSDWT